MYDLIVLGGGPAGYTAAVRAGQIGFETALIDPGKPGGICLRWGCIPMKCMMESARYYRLLADTERQEEFGVSLGDAGPVGFDWEKAAGRGRKISGQLVENVAGLLAAEGVEVIRGTASVTGQGMVTLGKRTLECRNILIATGSRIPPLPYPVPEDKVITPQAFFAERPFSGTGLDSRLPESAAVYGSGPVAVETAEFFALLGVEVELFLGPEGLMPGLDERLVESLEDHLVENGISLEKDPRALESRGSELKQDIIVNCGFRVPVIPEMRVRPDLDDGFLRVDRRMSTTLPGIYAAGDVTGLGYLSHAASRQGLRAVNSMKGIEERGGLSQVFTVYTHPEIAQVGITVQELEEEGRDYRIGEFPLSSNGKALAEGIAEGYVRVLYGPKLGEVFGVQIFAEGATDMIAEASLLMEMEGTVYDLAGTVHAHPSVSEIFFEAGKRSSPGPAPRK